MANITLMGASYTDVPAVTLPQTGGGTVTFYENGGGGASNVVIGTFKGSASEKGTAKTITVPYTGSGYPIAGVFYPSDGSWTSDNGIPALLHLNAVISWTFIKNDTSVTPDYSSNTDDNKAESYYLYKTSSSNATSTGGGRTHQNRIYRDRDATEYSDAMVKVCSATQLSVFIANTGYGFIADVDYTYVLIYSR